MKSTELQNLGLAKPRFRNTQNYTSNINNHVCQDLVLEDISKVRMSKIKIDLGFRLNISIKLGSPADC